MSPESRPPIRAAIAVPVTLLIAVCVLLSAWVVFLLKDAQWVDHTHAVLYRIQECESLVLQQQAALRGFIISGDPSFLATYDRARSRTPGSLDTLAEMTADNPSQQARIKGLRARYASWVARAEAERASPDRQPLLTDVSSRNAFVERQGDMSSMSSVIAQMVSEEQELLGQRQLKARNTTNQLFAALMIFAVAAGAFLVWFMRRSINQIETTYQSLLTDREHSMEGERQARIAAEELAKDVKSQLEEAERSLLTSRRNG